MADQEQDAQPVDAELVDGEGDVQEAQLPIDASAPKGNELVVVGEQGVQRAGETFLSELTDADVKAYEAALMTGDFGLLDTRQRMLAMYQKCKAMGLRMEMSPFVWAVMNKKLVPVRTKHASSYARGQNHINVRIVQQIMDWKSGVYLVMVEGSMLDPKAPGRVRKDYDIGGTSIVNLRGEALANAMMVAWTKAKNRVTESMETTGVDLSDDEAESVNKVLAEQASQPRSVDPEARLRRLSAPDPALEGTGIRADTDVMLRQAAGPGNPLINDDPAPLEVVGDPGEAANLPGGASAPQVRAPKAPPKGAQVGVPANAQPAPGPSAAGTASVVAPKASAPPQAKAAVGAVGIAPPTQTPPKVQQAPVQAPSAPPRGSGTTPVGAPRPPVARPGGGGPSPAPGPAPANPKPPQAAPVRAAAPKRK